MSPESEPATMEPGSIKPELQRSEDLSSKELSIKDSTIVDANTRCGSTKIWLAGFVAFFGTGLMAVVSYLDPGNLEADIQIGVGAGFSLLWWTAICCLVFAPGRARYLLLTQLPVLVLVSPLATATAVVATSIR